MNDEYHFVQAYVEWDERHYSLLNDLLLELTSNNIKYVILKMMKGYLLRITQKMWILSLSQAPMI